MIPDILQRYLSPPPMGEPAPLNDLPAASVGQEQNRLVLGIILSRTFERAPETKTNLPGCSKQCGQGASSTVPFLYTAKLMVVRVITQDAIGVKSLPSRTKCVTPVRQTDLNLKQPMKSSRAANAHWEQAM